MSRYVNQLPDATNINIDDFFIVANTETNETKKISFDMILTQISNSIFINKKSKFEKIKYNNTEYFDPTNKKYTKSYTAKQNCLVFWSITYNSSVSGSDPIAVEFSYNNKILNTFQIYPTHDASNDNCYASGMYTLAKGTTICLKSLTGDFIKKFKSLQLNYLIVSNG